MSQLLQIFSLLKNDFKSHREWDDVLSIKKSPHVEIARIYGAALTSEGIVKLLGNDGLWYELSETDNNFEYVASSVIQRLRWLRYLEKNSTIKDE